MPNQIKTITFIKFLESEGLKCIRIRSSHHIYAKPGLPRPCVVDSQHKNIPINHIKTNLSTLKITYEYFLKKIADLK